MCHKKHCWVLYYLRYSDPVKSALFGALSCFLTIFLVVTSESLHFQVTQVFLFTHLPCCCSCRHLLLKEHLGLSQMQLHFLCLPSPVERMHLPQCNSSAVTWICCIHDIAIFLNLDLQPLFFCSLYCCILDIYCCILDICLQSRLKYRGKK